MKVPFFKVPKVIPIHLILSVSSGGKSTYIDKHIGFLKKDIPIYLAHELLGEDLEEKLSKECVIHYNLFRPYLNNAQNLHKDTFDDDLLNDLIKYSSRIQAVLLLAPRGVVAKRMLLRNTGEALLRGHTKFTYPKYDLFELLQRINLKVLHQQWLRLLKSHNIPVNILDSSDSSFKKILFPEVDTFFDSERIPSYTRDEMKAIIKEGRFEYQQIHLSETLKTNGQDRSATFELIKKNILFKHKSVLDIGCAYGFFCYEIESQGAKQVVGTEQKNHRFVGANIIKQFKKSRCEFRFQNIFTAEVEEVFDIVLFLNVIHHLRDPITALYKLAKICRETLVIEFPTLKDNKFNATISPSEKINEDLPLIGVSKLSEKDQIFVFSHSALQRILVDNAETPFNNIAFYPSPMSDERSIAICTK